MQKIILIFRNEIRAVVLRPSFFITPVPVSHDRLHHHAGGRISPAQ